MSSLSLTPGRLVSRIGPSGSSSRWGAGIPLLLFAFFLILALSLSLQGCAALGLQAPSGFNEKVAAGYTGLAGVREATTALLSSRSITVDEAQKVQDRADAARAALDSAATLKDVDFKQAEARLASAVQVLLTLQDFVVRRRQGDRTTEVPR